MAIVRLYLLAVVLTLVACSADTAPANGDVPIGAVSMGGTISSGGTAANVAGGGTTAQPPAPVTCIDFEGVYDGDSTCSDGTGGSMHGVVTQDDYCRLTGTNSDGGSVTYYANGNAATREVISGGWRGTCTLTLTGNDFLEQCQLNGDFGATATCTWTGSRVPRTYSAQ